MVRPTDGDERRLVVVLVAGLGGEAIQRVYLWSVLAVDSWPWQEQGWPYLGGMCRHEVQPVCAHHCVQVIYRVSVPASDPRGPVQICAEVEDRGPPHRVYDGEFRCGVSRAPGQVRDRTAWEARAWGEMCRVTESPLRRLGIYTEVPELEAVTPRRDGGYRSCLGPRNSSSHWVVLSVLGLVLKDYGWSRLLARSCPP